MLIFGVGELHGGGGKIEFLPGVLEVMVVIGSLDYVIEIRMDHWIWVLFLKIELQKNLLK